MEHMRGRAITKFDLFKAAVRVERDLLHENVGIRTRSTRLSVELNLYCFHKDEFSIRPVQMHTANRDALNKSLCLVFTSMQRHASATLEKQLDNTREKKIHKELSHHIALCEQGLALLESANAERMLTDFGKLAREGWETKRKLSSAVTLPEIDSIYDEAMRLGAYGGKLCGAGGGGFLLFMAAPHVQDKIPKPLARRISSRSRWKTPALKSSSANTRSSRKTH